MPRIDEPILIPQHLCKILLLEDVHYPESYNVKNMAQMLKDKGIVNKNVLDVFRKIDRKFFLNHDLNRDESDNLRSIMIAAAGGNLNPYSDTPKPIGWNTTISAPSMHAETLKNLYEHLISAKSILDIGTGSGFLSAAMAYVAP